MTVVELIKMSESIVNTLMCNDELSLDEGFMDAVMSFGAAASDKAEALYYVRTQLRDRVELLKSESERIERMRERLQHEAEKVDALALELLDAYRELEGPGASIQGRTVALNTRKSKRVALDVPLDVLRRERPDLVVVTARADRRAIAQHLRRGRLPDGIAHFDEHENIAWK